ncbi:hypothetical protein FB567DRAFT_145612 [Paraphoma chrysanthemicola]|uniref:Ubiquitin-like-conjugating enzyme ATG10 n=1 Tax=Paraphoma chrysanthemicola TaxID=798071 RepID=A0A8K0QXI1_9PLEO|nr:hypothetical protein FB567DRAFT_145612 [Paraphoma chrysanthemicola]
MLSEFPNLTSAEFHEACLAFETRFSVHGREQHDWVSVEALHSFDARFLRITKELINDTPVDPGEDEFLEDDVEALETSSQQNALMHYDIVFSPTYRVPVLYISIIDPKHRYPPTMTTLHKHLLPALFTAETGRVGVIGGITVTDHPATNRPAFFIHPCQTAKVMEATVGRKEISGEEFLVIWIGAMGKYVGLNIPLALVQQDVLQIGVTQTP